MKRIIITLSLILAMAVISSCGKAGNTFSKKKSTEDPAASEESRDQSTDTVQDAMTGTDTESIAASEGEGVIPALTPEDTVVSEDPNLHLKEPDNTEDHDPLTETIEGSSQYKVAMVTDTAGINDHSFNQAAWEGLTQLNADTGAGVKYMGISDETDYIKNIESLISDDYTFIWGVGYESADAVMSEALNHPDTKFAILDFAFEDTPDNLTGVTFRAQEPSFMVGYIAVAVTKSDKIGFVGGVPGDTIDAFHYGFLSGVAYANRELSKNVSVDVRYAGSFNDVQEGLALAKEMYDDGCDVVYQAAGNTGLGVIQAAVDAGPGKYVIGVDRDQAYLAPENVLTSAIKNIAIAVENVSVQYMMNDNIHGINLDFGLSEHTVGISQEHGNYSEEIYQRALEIGDDIASNTIIVPSNQAEYDEYVSALNSKE